MIDYVYRVVRKVGIAYAYDYAYFNNKCYAVAYLRTHPKYDGVETIAWNNGCYKKIIYEPRSVVIG